MTASVASGVQTRAMLSLPRLLCTLAHPNVARTDTRIPNHDSVQHRSNSVVSLHVLAFRTECFNASSPARSDHERPADWRRLIDFMQLLKLPHTIAVLAALLVFFGALYYLFALTITQSVALLADDEFKHTFKAQVVRLRTALASHEIYIAELDELADLPAVNGSAEDQPTIQELASLVDHLEAVAQLFADIPFMLVMLVCMLFARQPKSAAETNTPPHLMTITEQIESQVGSYIISKFGLSLLTGTCTWIFLWIYDVQLAVLFGILACILNFIPSLGSVSPIC